MTQSLRHVPSGHWKLRWQRCCPVVSPPHDREDFRSFLGVPFVRRALCLYSAETDCPLYLSLRSSSDPLFLLRVVVGQWHVGECHTCDAIVKHVDPGADRGMLGHSLKGDEKLLSANANARHIACKVNKPGVCPHQLGFHLHIERQSFFVETPVEAARDPLNHRREHRRIDRIAYLSRSGMYRRVFTISLRRISFRRIPRKVTSQSALVSGVSTPAPKETNSRKRSSMLLRLPLGRSQAGTVIKFVRSPENTDFGGTWS